MSGGASVLRIVRYVEGRSLAAPKASGLRLAFNIVNVLLTV